MNSFTTQISKIKELSFERIAHYLFAVDGLEKIEKLTESSALHFRYEDDQYMIALSSIPPLHRVKKDRYIISCSLFVENEDGSWTKVIMTPSKTIADIHGKAITIINQCCDLEKI